MEFQSNGAEHISHDSYYLTAEQIALQALVDELILRNDNETFLTLNKILESTHDE